MLQNNRALPLQKVEKQNNQWVFSEQKGLKPYIS